jgi:hypothetical protein
MSSSSWSARLAVFFGVLAALAVPGAIIAAQELSGITLLHALYVGTPVSVGLGLLALLGLFVLGLDQGQTLALWQGDAAYQANLIHELVHDARHVAGFPCH